MKFDAHRKHLTTTLLSEIIVQLFHYDYWKIYTIITQTIFPRNSTQGIVRSLVIARVSAPVKMASVNIKISNYGHQLSEQLIYSGFFYLTAGPRATPHWVGSASGTGLRDPESRGPVPDAAETLGLGIRYRTPRHFW